MPSETIGDQAGTAESNFELAQPAKQNFASIPAAVEPATPSGSLTIPAPIREQRTNLKRALFYASIIAQSARYAIRRHQYTSKSPKPYHNDVRIHRIIYDYLNPLHKSDPDIEARFNSAMNKLNIAWIGGDPRDALFAYPIPFRQSSSYLSLEHDYYRTLGEALQNMVRTAESLGYTVRDEAFWDPRYPHVERMQVLTNEFATSYLRI